MLNHRQVEVFHAIMVAGGVSRAAQSLGVSQPAVSRTLQQLERELGFALFSRRRGRLVATPEGIAFHREVERSFLGMTTLVESGRAIAQHLRGSLRIACLPALSYGFLPRVTAEFLRDRPDVTVSIQTQNSTNVASWLAARTFDLGIAMLPVLHDDIDVELFDEAEGVCVVPVGHPLARKGVITPQDLAGEPFILIGGESLMRYTIIEAFVPANLRPNVRIETPLSATACSLVAAGAGVSVVDPFTASDFAVQGIVARPFRPLIRFRFDFVLPTHIPRSLLAQEFMSQMRRARAYRCE